MTPKPRADKPQWFLQKDYSYLKNLTPSGWHTELGHCVKRLENIRRQNAGEPSYECMWRQILGEDVDLPLAWPPTPAVEVVESADQATLHAIERPALILKINLRAANADIMCEVKKAIEAARQQFPSLLKVPGPPTLNATFDAQVYSRWVRHKIVELSELEEWRVCNPEGNEFRRADVGEWLFENYADPDKEVSTAFNVLDAAVALLPALAMHITTNPHEAARVKQDTAPKTRVTNDSGELSGR